MAKAATGGGGGGEDFDAVLKSLRECQSKDTTTWHRGSNRLRKLGPRAEAPLIEILTARAPGAQDDPMLRVAAATAIYGQEIHSPAIVAALLETMNDPHPSVRSMSVQAFVRVAPLAGVEIPDAAIANRVAALQNGGKSRYGEAMAMNALAAIVKGRAAAAVPALIDTLADRDWEARCGALASLRHIGPPAATAAVPHLLRLIAEDKNDQARASAAGGLPEIGAPAAQAVPPLIRALTDPKPWVRQCAAGALGAYGPDAATDATAPLEALLTDKTPAVRKAAAEALTAMGRPVAPVEKPKKASRKR